MPSTPTPESRPPVDRDNLVTQISVRSAMLTGIFVLLVMYTLYFAATLFIPLIVAFLISLIFTPVVRALRVLKIPPPVSAAVAVVAVLAFAFGSLYGLSKPAEQWLQKAPQDLQRIELKLQNLQAPIEKLQQARQQLDQMAPGEQNKDNGAGTQWSPVQWLLNGTWSALYGITLSVILLYFMLASGDTFLRKLVRVIPQFHDKRAAVETVRLIQTSIATYLGTITLINLALAAVAALTLYLFDVPNPVLFGAMVGLLNYAPYVGSVISTTVLLAVCLLTFQGGLLDIVLPPAVVLAFNVLEGQFITPTIAGHRLALSPVAVFLSILLWGWMWGVVGILIAVPLLVCIKLVCDNIESLSIVSEFLGH
ncbi:hypothetical protein CEK62_17755 [Alcanivorax sp. N3-2A]|mgnify:CR=1 FL=1|nr:hypothetical protein CEK62_17755 [Alcanivorax sp. N3-2A]